MSYELDYTKGEWRLSKSGNSNQSNYLIYVKNICSCCNHTEEKTILRHECHNSAEQDNNFRLMKHSPKMFELLKRYALLDEEYYSEFAGFIKETKQLLTEITK